MTTIVPVLARLGLSQYTAEFVDEGFDTWETVLDITESDLDLLNVKLGHRRKLQREIANARGLSLQQSVQAPTTWALGEDHQYGEHDSGATKTDNRRTNGHGGKRKYRRHPKPDEYAPERPPSAYVIFSNKCRGDLKPQSLSFTSIAKLVGERWQALAAEEKDSFESQATSRKEKYNTELAKYRRTNNYKDHLEYLIEFKAKHNRPEIGSDTKPKRPKMNTHSSTETESLHSRHGSGTTGFATQRPRFDSVESGTASPTLNMPPPASLTGKSTSPVSLSLMDFSSHPSPSGLRLTGSPPTSSRADGVTKWAFDASIGTTLPRILPLDHHGIRTDSAALSPLMTDTPVLRNPNLRYAHPRSSTHAPASLLRDDTRSSMSSSSRSSYLSSSGNGGSTHHTPMSPAEESCLPKGLPPLSSIACGGGTTISSGIGTGRSYSSQPTISQSFSTNNSTSSLSSDYVSSAAGRSYNTDRTSSKHSPRVEHSTAQSSRSFRAGAYAGADLQSPRDQWNYIPESDGRDYLRESTASYLQKPHGTSIQELNMSTPNQELQDSIFKQRPKRMPHQEEPSTNPRQSRPLDGLSVLAFAGRMIDRDAHKPP